MKTVQVDDEVYAYIKSKAEPYEPFKETEPNMTLRRLLGLEPRAAESSRASFPPTSGRGESKMTALTTPSRFQRKSPKVDLYELVAKGLLQDDQTLYLYDYQKRRVPGYQAKLSGRFLIYEGKHYSMSELAKHLLKLLGYRSESVRGPMFWGTDDGFTVKDLWEKAAKRNGVH
jgi:hypothetical protein